MRKNRVEYYRDELREWRWRVIAPNGNILADSGEGYKNRRDCRAGYQSMHQKTI